MTEYSNVIPVIMSDMNDNLSSWLANELIIRGWSQSKLAKLAGVSKTAISDAISGKNPPKFDVCVAIAKALRLPPEEVLRKAGLLPKQSSNVTEDQERLLYLFNNLTPEKQKYALKLLAALGEEV